MSTPKPNGKTETARPVGSSEWLDDILGRVWCREMSGDEAMVELSWLTGTIEELQKDAITMAMRLLGEDSNTFSPECREVMSRWGPKCENLLSSNTKLTEAATRYDQRET